jgi:hypothetical protein
VVRNEGGERGGKGRNYSKYSVKGIISREEYFVEAL